MYCRLKIKLSPQPALTNGHRVALCDFWGGGWERGIRVATEWICLWVHFRATLQLRERMKIVLGWCMFKC